MGTGSLLAARKDSSKEKDVTRTAPEPLAGPDLAARWRAEADGIWPKDENLTARNRLEDQRRQRAAVLRQCADEAASERQRVRDVAVELIRVYDWAPAGLITPQNPRAARWAGDLITLVRELAGTP